MDESNTAFSYCLFIVGENFFQNERKEIEIKHFQLLYKNYCVCCIKYAIVAMKYAIK